MVPKLFLIAVAPLIVMALLSSFAIPGYANKVYWAVTGQSGDASDDVVWSNVAYPLAAIGAWPDLTAMAVIWFVGCFLAVASASYHSTYKRWAQRFDVTAMMGYLSSLTAAVLASWTPWAWGLVPIATILYWRYTWQINSFLHAPLWMAATIIPLLIQVGVGGLYALIPVALGAIPAYFGSSDSIYHSFWHLGGAVSVALVLYFI